MIRLYIYIKQVIEVQISYCIYPGYWDILIAYILVLKSEQAHLQTVGRVANSVDPDQTPRSVASDLGLHCLIRSV